MKTKLFFGCVLMALASILLMAGSGGTLYRGKFVDGGYNPAFVGNASGLTNAHSTNLFSGGGYVVATGFIGDGSLLSGLPGGGDVTTAQLNSASNVLFAATVSSTGAVSIASSLNATQGLASALGAIYATDAELASATNAATLASSVNATNAGNIMFKVGSNFITANNTWTISPLGSAASLSNAVDIIAGTSITVSTGANNRSFTISSTASGTAVPFTNTTFGYGFNTNSGTLVATQLLVLGPAEGSMLMVGSANSRSNTIVSISGSNDLHFRAGMNTNNFGSSNGVFTVYDDAVFARSITGNGASITNLNGTNVQGSVSSALNLPAGVTVNPVNGNNMTNVLEKNVAVSTNSALGGQTVDFSRGTMQLTNFPAGNVTLDAITGFTTSNLNWVTIDIQPDAAAVRTLTVNASWFVSGFTNATVVAITNGQWAELTITAIIGRRTNASIVFWQ